MPASFSSDVIPAASNFSIVLGPTPASLLRKLMCFSNTHTSGGMAPQILWLRLRSLPTHEFIPFHLKFPALPSQTAVEQEPNPRWTQSPAATSQRGPPS